MNREELFKLHQELSSIALEIMKNKNEDYSLGHPFGNFMVAEALQASTAENGIIIRMSDKLSRLVSVFAKGAKVKDESIKDTIIDIINYAVLMYGVYVHKSELGEEENMSESVPVFIAKEDIRVGQCVDLDWHKGTATLSRGKKL